MFLAIGSTAPASNDIAQPGHPTLAVRTDVARSRACFNAGKMGRTSTASCSLQISIGRIRSTSEQMSFVLPFRSRNRRAGEGKGRPTMATRSGPRHLLFHPHRPIALLICELATTLSLTEVADGTLSILQAASTLPSGFAGESLGGHIALNEEGVRVYVSNRGHDSISVFELDEARGPTLIQNVESGGTSPRYFLFLEAQRQADCRERGRKQLSGVRDRGGRFANTA